jgi:hypothetical protein
VDRVTEWNIGPRAGLAVLVVMACMSQGTKGEDANSVVVVRRGDVICVVARRALYEEASDIPVVGRGS